MLKGLNHQIRILFEFFSVFLILLSKYKNIEFDLDLFKNCLPFCKCQNALFFLMEYLFLNFNFVHQVCNIYFN